MVYNMSVPKSNIVSSTATPLLPHPGSRLNELYLPDLPKPRESADIVIRLHSHPSTL